MDDVMRSQRALANGWTAGDVVAKWGDGALRLHYVRTGGSKPPLVMAHGHSDNALCWIRVAQALEADYDCIMYDARGHGLSEDGPEGVPGEALAQDAAAFVKVLGLAKPGMIGHSMGARTAAGAAALYPDLLSYIILEDPPWFDEETRKRWDRARPQAAQEEQPTTRQGWVDRCHKQNPNWHEDEVQAWADSKMYYHSRPPGSMSAWARSRPGRRSAAKITIPTLLLTGDSERGAIVTAASGPGGDGPAQAGAGGAYPRRGALHPSRPVRSRHGRHPCVPGEGGVGELAQLGGLYGRTGGHGYRRRWPGGPGQLNR